MLITNMICKKWYISPDVSLACNNRIINFGAKQPLQVTFFFYFFFNRTILTDRYNELLLGNEYGKLSSCCPVI